MHNYTADKNAKNNIKTYWNVIERWTWEYQASDDDARRILKMHHQKMHKKKEKHIYSQ